jgi:pyruvate dehydrogenase E2 component (dihydrolipoamide acetyltransferase)
VKDQLAESGVTYTDLLVRTVAVVLTRHAALNARWEDGAVWEYDRVNVGLAVQTERGLLVPVLRDASAFSPSQIAERRRELVERAHAGKLTPPELEGATFTLTNLGMFNIGAAWPIINPPQAAILAVGAIAPRVIPIDGTPAVRSAVDLVLAVDHRVVDGALAAQFLADLRRTLEDSTFFLVAQSRPK